MCDWVDICGKEEVSDLMTQVGDYVSMRVRWDAAAMTYQGALDLRSEVLGKNCPKSVESLRDLRCVFYYQHLDQDSEEQLSARRIS